MRVYVIVRDEETDISDGTPLEVVNIDRLGASLATRITERSPAQDGDTDIDRILEPRVIPLVVQARPNEIYNYRQCREEINRLFRATNVPIVLGIEFDDGTIFHIDTKSVGDINLPLNINEFQLIRAGVTLRAARPVFYDPNGVSVSFGLSASGGAFFVPTSIPTFFGGSTLDQTVPIAYDGTYFALPIIIAYGPITNLVITNLSTGAKIDFTGYTIVNGDYVTIDLTSGRKIAYRNGDPSLSVLDKISADSNLASFRLDPDPDVIGGINSIKVTGSALTGVSQVYIQYYRMFDGI